MKRLMFAVAALAFGISPAMALDEPTGAAQQPRAVTVSYEDLDLGQSQDAEALMSRLRYAAMRACEVNAVAQPGPALRRRIEECRAAALEEAVRQTDSPEVSRLYSEQRR